MSFSINKVKESFGRLSSPEIYSSTAVKRFPGAFSIGTSKRCFNIFKISDFEINFLIAPLFTIDQSLPGPGTYDVIHEKNSLPKWKFTQSQRVTFSADQNPSPMAYSTTSALVLFLNRNK